MRKSLLFGIFLVAVAAINAEGQTLSVSEAQKLLFGNSPGQQDTSCGVLIPLGEHKFQVLEAAEGMDKYELGKTVTTLKDIGAINIVDLPSMIGFVHFRVELKSNLDKSKLGFLGPAACIISDMVSPTYNVVKVELVKGGTTKWDGAIIYFSITNRKVSDLYTSYVKARKAEYLAGDLRRRWLWRYDPFTKWGATFFSDDGPLNGGFLTQNVSAGLRQD